MGFILGHLVLHPEDCFSLHLCGEESGAHRCLQTAPAEVERRESPGGGGGLAGSRVAVHPSLAPQKQRLQGQPLACGGWASMTLRKPALLWLRAVRMGHTYQAQASKTGCDTVILSCPKNDNCNTAYLA